MRHLEPVGQPAPQVGGDGDGGADEPLRRRPLRQLRGLGRGLGLGSGLGLGLGIGVVMVGRTC